MRFIKSFLLGMAVSTNHDLGKHRGIPVQRPLPLFLLTALCFTAGAIALCDSKVYASEPRTGHEAVHTEHGEEHSGGHEAVHTGHGEEHGGEHEAHGGGHHSPPPQMYYINWALIGTAFLITCFYCLWVYKRGKPEHEGLFLAFILVSFAIAIYVTNQFPEVQRHFDAASHSFVDGYHEPPQTGFIKFLYKMALGVFLMIHGLIGMEHH